MEMARYGRHTEYLYLIPAVASVSQAICLLLGNSNWTLFIKPGVDGTGGRCHTPSGQVPV